MSASYSTLRSVTIVTDRGGSLNLSVNAEELDSLLAVLERSEQVEEYSVWKRPA